MRRAWTETLRARLELARMGLLAALLLLAAPLSASTALANGGTLQVSEAPAGPYRLSVYTSPSPLRVGLADVSVLVQRGESEELVQDAQVSVTAEPVGHAGTAGTYPATHELATNKLFYAAHVPLDSEGPWRINVAVEGQEGQGQVAFEVQVGQPGLLDGPLAWVVLALLPVLMVALLIWRGRKRPPGPRRKPGKTRSRG